jgi:Ribbon-helix-helix protein, copG family
MTRGPTADLPITQGQEEAAFDQALDQHGVYPKVYHMRTVATKLPADLAAQVEHAARKEKTTVSAFLRKAVENEVAGRRTTFGAKFGHLLGTGRKLPADASQKEGYED